MSDGGDHTCGFVSHDERGDTATGATVEAVDIRAAYAAGADADEDIIGTAGGFWEVDNFEFLDFCEQKSLHDSLALSRRIYRVELVVCPWGGCREGSFLSGMVCKFLGRCCSLWSVPEVVFSKIIGWRCGEL